MTRGRPTLANRGVHRERAWLEARVKEGKSVTEIAVEAGITPKNVRVWLRRHGLYQETRPPRLGKRYPRTAEKWKDKQWLSQMRAKGHTLRQMGKMAGCSAEQIRLSLGG